MAWNDKDINWQNTRKMNWLRGCRIHLHLKIPFETWIKHLNIWGWRSFNTNAFHDIWKLRLPKRVLNGTHSLTKNPWRILSSIKGELLMSVRLHSDKRQRIRPTIQNYDFIIWFYYFKFILICPVHIGPIKMEIWKSIKEGYISYTVPLMWM